MHPSVLSKVRDPQRLAALRETDLLDAPHEESFDRLTRLAARLLDAPTALVTLIDADRQFFISYCGLAEPAASQRETPLSHSFCPHVVHQAGPLIVEDAREHPLVRDNPAIADFGVIAYAGMPLQTRDGHVLGSLCVLDTRPRQWTEEQLALLSDLAAGAATEVELRREIARRQRAEVSLRQSEAKFRTIFEEAAEGLFLVDREPDGGFRYVDANAALQRITGLDVERFVGSTPQEVLAPDTAARAISLYRQVFDTGYSMAVERVNVLPRGAVATRTRYHPLHAGDGTVVRVLGITEDVTERHRMQEALQDSERHFRSLIENASDVITILDADGTIRYESPSVKRILGYLPEELIDRNIFDFIYPADQPAIVEAITEGLSRPGAPISYEIRFRHKNGAWCWLSGIGTNLLDDPAVQGLVANSRDITEQKHAQAATQRYSKELERSNRELQEFAYVASHDLQEPLRKIRAFGDLLRSRYGDALGEQGLEFLEWMRDAATRMQLLIDEVLAFSRVATHERSHTQVSLKEIVRSAADDLEIRLADAGGRLDIGDLCSVEADAGQMKQLFQNLIANALKFHRRGVPPLVVIRAAAEGGVCRIEVEDNGIGFEARFVDRIFTPFQRLHGRSEFEGSGMGLAICRRIAERHGGGITAHSTPGSGSTFVVTLPLRQAADEEERFPAQPSDSE